MPLDDYYNAVDEALEHLNDALDLLEDIPVTEIEREKVQVFEDLFERLDNVAEELEALVERDGDEEEESKDVVETPPDVIEAEFKEL